MALGVRKCSLRGECQRALWKEGPYEEVAHEKASVRTRRNLRDHGRKPQGREKVTATKRAEVGLKRWCAEEGKLEGHRVRARGRGRRGP